MLCYNDVLEQFVGADKLLKCVNNTEIPIKDYKLIRYICYLIAKNDESRKTAIAFGQTYFAIQTKRINSTY